jgi:hypothetical protein
LTTEKIHKCMYAFAGGSWHYHKPNIWQHPPALVVALAAHGHF